MSDTDQPIPDASPVTDANYLLANRTEMSMLAHPLFVQSIVLQTHPIRFLVGALRRAIMLREPVCFSAPSGFGKSYGLTMASKELKRMFPDTTIYFHVVNNKHVPSIRSFFKHFLHTVGITDLKGETSDLRVRLMNRLIDAGRASTLKAVVLLIDETQGMGLEDFQFLKDIGNQMDKVNLRLVVAMMGQEPDFSVTLSELRKQGRLDIISRLTLRRLTFPGLTTQDHIRDVLEMIDTEIFPQGSSITWPQYFGPKAWESGFRMANQLEPLCSALCARLPDNSLSGGVPARQLFLAIRRFMLELADIESSGVPMPSDIWDQCVEYALIEDAAAITAERMDISHGRTTF